MHKQLHCFDDLIVRVLQIHGLWLLGGSSGEFRRLDTWDAWED
jgi:hypothetical protein